MKTFTLTILLLTILTPDTLTSLSNTASLSSILLQEEVAEVDLLIKQLYPTTIGDTIYGPDSKTQRQVQRRLLALAEASAENRQVVITKLIEMLNDIDIYQTGICLACHVGANVLAKLKATEAIDLLVERIDYTDIVTSSTLTSRPMLRAVIEIGEPTVPTLEEALVNGKTSVKQSAAMALGMIGGERAKAALERALMRETDESIQQEVQFWLDEMKHKEPNG